jgi:hypothetical protein
MFSMIAGDLARKEREIKIRDAEKAHRLVGPSGTYGRPSVLRSLLFFIPRD